MIIPLSIHLQPSYRLLAMLSLMHAVGLVAMLAVPMPVWLKIAISAAVAVSLAFHLRREKHPELRQLQIRTDGLWVETRHAGWQSADVLDSSFVTPWLTVLHLSLPGRRRPCAIVMLQDSLPGDDFRRLRVWLRWSDARSHGKDLPAVL